MSVEISYIHEHVKTIRSRQDEIFKRINDIDCHLGLIKSSQMEIQRLLKEQRGQALEEQKAMTPQVASPAECIQTNDDDEPRPRITDDPLPGGARGWPN